MNFETGMVTYFEHLRNVEKHQVGVKILGKSESWDLVLRLVWCRVLKIYKMSKIIIWSEIFRIEGWVLSWLSDAFFRAFPKCREKN